MEYHVTFVANHRFCFAVLYPNFRLISPSLIFMIIKLIKFNKSVKLIKSFKFEASQIDQCISVKQIISKCFLRHLSYSITVNVRYIYKELLLLFFLPVLRVVYPMFIPLRALTSITLISLFYIGVLLELQNERSNTSLEWNPFFLPF